MVDKSSLWISAISAKTEDFAVIGVGKWGRGQRVCGSPGISLVFFLKQCCSGVAFDCCFSISTTGNWFRILRLCDVSVNDHRVNVDRRSPEL